MDPLTGPEFKNFKMVLDEASKNPIRQYGPIFRHS